MHGGYFFMSKNKNKIKKLNDEQYAEYIATLKERDLLPCEKTPDVKDETSDEK
jgi:hypothetical protein